MLSSCRSGRSTNSRLRVGAVTGSSTDQSGTLRSATISTILSSSRTLQSTAMTMLCGSLDIATASAISCPAWIQRHFHEQDHLELQPVEFSKLFLVETLGHTLSSALSVQTAGHWVGLSANFTSLRQGMDLITGSLPCFARFGKISFSDAKEIHFIQTKSVLSAAVRTKSEDWKCPTYLGSGSNGSNLLLWCPH